MQCPDSCVPKLFRADRHLRCARREPHTSPLPSATLGLQAANSGKRRTAFQTGPTRAPHSLASLQNQPNVLKQGSSAKWKPSCIRAQERRSRSPLRTLECAKVSFFGYQAAILGSPAYRPSVKCGSAVSCRDFFTFPRTKSGSGDNDWLTCLRIKVKGGCSFPVKVIWGHDTLWARKRGANPECLPLLNLQAVSRSAWSSCWIMSNIAEPKPRPIWTAFYGCDTMHI